MRRLRGALALGAILLLMSAPMASAGEGELTIRIADDGNVTISDPEDIVDNATADPPERYAWQLNLTGDYHTAEVLIDKGFPIQRGAQMVPLFDGKHFVETKGSNVSDVDRPANVYNLTEEPSAYRYGLGLPGPGESQLTLERDLEPPEVEVASIENRTHIGFDVRTNTSEPAQAELVVYDTSGEPVQSYPTPHPGVFQVFPVQGLDANTTYTFDVTVSDWSGNEATSEERTVTTRPAPNPPEPIVKPVRPEPGSTVAPNELVVEASFESNGSLIVHDEIRLFFDKERVDRANVQVGEDSITYRPEDPLAEREYFVSVEVPNEAGGTGVASWSFQVQVPQSTPSPLSPIVVLVGLTCVSLALTGRRAVR